MTALVTIPPRLYDQTFPKDRRDLNEILCALGEISIAIQQGHVKLVRSEVFEAFLPDFWVSISNHENSVGSEHFSTLREVYRFLFDLSVNHVGIETVNLASFKATVPHPMPSDCTKDEAGEYWAEETGKLLSKHDSISGQKGRGYFIGIICGKGFFCGKVGKYHAPLPDRYFPLVGKRELENLESAYKYAMPKGPAPKNIFQANVVKNIKIFDGKIGKTVGSHRQIQFPGKRTWPLDLNHDPVLTNHINTLATTLSEDVSLVKYVLIHGRYPEKVCII